MFLDNSFMHDSFLYATNSSFHNVFRIIICMKEEVQGEVLQYAVNRAIKRYPYFAIKVEKHETGYDIVKNEKPIVVYRGFQAPCLGTLETNDHFIAVGYEGSHLFIDCYHSLTDGAGVTPFAKTLVYYYLCEAMGEQLDVSGINLEEDPIAPDEFCDPTVRIETYPEQPFYEYKGEEPFHLGDATRDSEGRETTYYLKIHEKSFMEHAKSNDSTPNAALAAIFYQALLQHHPDVKAPIVAGVAMTTRPALHMENSAANLVSLLNLKYTPNMKDFDLMKLGTLGRGMMLLQAQTENVLFGIKNRKKLVEYLDALPSDEARQQAYYAMILRMKAMDTFFISYTGKKDWGAVEPYIDGLYVLSPNGANCFGVNVYAINGAFSVAVNQSFASDIYVKSVMEILDREGILYSYEGNSNMELPEVKVIESVDASDMG